MLKTTIELDFSALAQSPVDLVVTGKPRMRFGRVCSGSRLRRFSIRAHRNMRGYFCRVDLSESDIIKITRTLTQHQIPMAQPGRMERRPNTNYSVQRVRFAFLRQIVFGTFAQYIAGHFVSQCFGWYPLL